MTSCKSDLFCPTKLSWRMTPLLLDVFSGFTLTKACAAVHLFTAWCNHTTVSPNLLLFSSALKDIMWTWYDMFCHSLTVNSRCVEEPLLKHEWLNSLKITIICSYATAVKRHQESFHSSSLYIEQSRSLPIQAAWHRLRANCCCGRANWVITIRIRDTLFTSYNKCTELRPGEGSRRKNALYKPFSLSSLH